jgi:hypothetical protein
MTCPSVFSWIISATNPSNMAWSGASSRVSPAPLPPPSRRTRRKLTAPPPPTGNPCASPCGCACAGEAQRRKVSRRRETPCHATDGDYEGAHEPTQGTHTHATAFAHPSIQHTHRSACASHSNLRSEGHERAHKRGRVQGCGQTNPYIQTKIHDI